MRARKALCSMWGLGVRDAGGAAPALVSATCMVPPADETEVLRCVPERRCVPHWGVYMTSGGSGRQMRRLDAVLCRAS